MAFRPDLQGLRAIAVLLVILAHSGLELVSGGFIGVDVFFVISGYLITAILVSEFQQTGQINFLNFYTRRLKRLLPALMLMISLIALAAVWLLSGFEAGKQLASGPYAATWTANLYFVFVTLGYFDELSSRDLFLHTWSLGVEEQFYLIWPLVLLIPLLLQQKQPTKGLVNRGLVTSTVGILCLVSLVLSLYWIHFHPQWAFYLLPARAWQLALGALVFLSFNDQTREARVSNTRSGRLLLAAGIILIFTSAISFHNGLAYPGYRALVPSMGAALVIASGHRQFAGFWNPLAHPILVWIGDRSYSLYLWHWPILVLGFALGLKGETSLTLYLLLLILMLAMLSYRFVELPFWKGRFSHARPRLTLLTGVLIMAGVTSGFYHGLRTLPQTGPGNPPRHDLPVIYSMECDAWVFHARVEPCVFGPDTASRTVAFVGDSHGAQWFSFLPEIYSLPEWRIVVLTKSSCPLVDEDYFYPNIGRIFEVCTEWRNGVLDELDRIRPDILFIGSASTYDFSAQQWVAGSARVFERMSKAAGEVFVIPGTPTLGFDGPGCVTRNTTPEGDIDPSACRAIDRMQVPDQVTRYLEQAAEQFDNIRILNLNDLVCPEGICSAITSKGQVMFRDSQHLTDTFVRTQFRSIRAKLFEFTNRQGNVRN